MESLVNDFLLFLWQLPQALVSIIAHLIYKHESMFIIKDGSKRAYVMKVDMGRKAAFALYDRIFIDRSFFEGKTKGTLEETIRHEYGHVMQSRILGWLYLFVIAIPSVLCTSVMPNYVRKFYMEKWANKLSANRHLDIVD